MSSDNNSGKKHKAFPGMKGDPRMNRAVAARLKDPDMSLLNALRAGGFTFPKGQIDGLSVDSDGVQLCQRKNQLSRRLRCERWRYEQQQQQPQNPQQQNQRRRQVRKSSTYDVSSGDAGSACSSSDECSSRKRPLASSPGAIDHTKRRNVSPDLVPLATPLSGTNLYMPNSPSQLMVQVFPPVISPPTISEAVQQDNFVPLQQRRPPVPRSPTPIPLADLSEDGRQTSGKDFEPGDVTSTADGPEYVGSSGFCGDSVDEEERAKRFLLKTFKIDIESDPVFTEDEKQENITLLCFPDEKQEEERGQPPEERAAALADLRGQYATTKAIDSLLRHSFLGKLFSIGAVTQGNLPRLVPLSIKFLLQEMREHVCVLQGKGVCKPEVDAAISRDLLQSQSKCDRLELFLRREEMDPKLAAIRFVKYWTRRYELFGSEKFSLPMTLKGAMQDDITALKTGTFRLMPEPDSYGRRILYMQHSFNKEDGYTSDSMYRVCWYMLESLLEDPATTQKGFVLVTWDRDTTLWNYDRRLDSSFAGMEKECIPIRFAAIHICHYSNLVMSLLKPITLGMVERRVRNRMWWHSESGVELYDKLGVCGITQDMVPIEMGGTSQYDHLSWIRERTEAGK